MYIAAIVLAAGSGSRMGGNVKKQYLDLGGQPVLWHSLNAFQKSIADEIILVCSKEDIDEVSSIYKGQFSKLTKVVCGGANRYDSVYAGLCAVRSADLVFIHDGARPFIKPDMIAECAKTLETEDACVCAVLSKDTVKIADADGYVESTPDRSRVWIIQTPQCFRFDVAYGAYSRLMKALKEDAGIGRDVTDDAMVVERFSDTKVKLLKCSYDNIKLTTPDDLILAERIIANENK